MHFFVVTSEDVVLLLKLFCRRNLRNSTTSQTCCV